MAKDMKTRKGKDNIYYPYTSPDIVIDNTGESQTTKNNNMKNDIQLIKDSQIILEEDETSMEGMSDNEYPTLTTTNKTIIGGINEVNAQYKDIENKIENRELLLSEIGCTSNEEDATNNTLIIQNLINSGKSFMIDISVPINDTIIIKTNFNGKYITGKYKSLIMITDNKPILKFDTILTNNITFENINLAYKNFQKNYDNSIAIYFESNESSSYGWYDLVFKNMMIKNSFIGIGNITSEPLWDTVFENILISDVYRHAISLDKSGQLGIQFRNIRIRNYGIRDTDNANDNNTCIILKGEFSFNNLTVEDWNGQIFKSEDCNCVFENLHIERSRFLVDTYLYVFSCSGNLSFKNVTMTFTKMNVPTKFVRVFELLNATKINIDGFCMNYNDSKFIGRIFLVNGNENTEIITSGVKGIDIIDAVYNPKIKGNMKSIINGVPITQVIKFNSIPADIDYNKGDIIYNQNPAVGSNVGWVALANSKNTNKLSFTISSNYNTVFTTSINNVPQYVKIGDGLIVDGDTTLYIVQSVTNNNFSVLPQPNKNFQKASIRNATTSEVMREFGIIQ